MSALSLRIFASICMLLDHLGFLFPQYPLLRYIGRLAFPIYIFLLVNGYRHSSSRLRYALRLGLFALISQVPFTLFCGYESYFTKGNVFVTLLVALLVLWLTDTLARQKKLRFLAPLPALLAYGLYYLGWLSSDYGQIGFLLALSFFYLEDRRLLCLVSCFVSVYHSLFLGYAVQLKELLLGRGAVFAPPKPWAQAQAFSLLALLPIFLYNGRKGNAPASPLGKRILQWGFYLFYPLHLAILYLLA